MYAHVLIHDQVARNRTAFYLQQHVERETKTNQLAITHGQLCCWVYCATCSVCIMALLGSQKERGKVKGKEWELKRFPGLNGL